MSGIAAPDYLDLTTLAVQACPALAQADIRRCRCDPVW
jgi:hypothetical protein